MPDRDRPRNQILAALQPDEWANLRAAAEHVSFPLGHTLFHPSTAGTTVYFPDTGVISVVDVLEDGHNVEVAAVGREGLCGIARLVGIERMPFWLIVQVPSSGFLIQKDSFRQLFEGSDPLRRLLLAHFARLTVQLARSASCNRFHTHRQRLARWLLVLMRKSEQCAFEMTHEFIAQMVGGPRHAVSAVLNELRALGAITYLRGRIEVVDRSRLIACACECHHIG